MKIWLIVAIVIGIFLLLSGSFASASIVLGNNTKSDGYSSYGGGNSGQGQLVLFYTDWCGYCKDLKPIWAKLQKEFGSTLVSVDADKHSFLKKSYGVRGYPSIYWCPKGASNSATIAEQYNGSRDEESIRDFINQKLD